MFKAVLAVTLLLLFWPAGLVYILYQLFQVK
jgi:hypothetical protein